MKLSPASYQPGEKETLSGEIARSLPYPKPETLSGWGFDWFGRECDRSSPVKVSN
ncbi:hypothetical protein [Coleofasciculus sp. E1-EBD-02]|uniref:hypothetical protein n=1 Tax=Coleofasciculus sp. E1-EBD-02 TaxID=3068481 RepID=UPI0032FAA46A